MNPNKPMRYAGARSPEELYADRQDEIRLLRKTDQVFDEICRDFEVIAKILLEDQQCGQAAEESLAGLSDEIRLRLYRHSGQE